MCFVITIIPDSTALFGILQPYNADMKRFPSVITCEEICARELSCTFYLGRRLKIEFTGISNLNHDFLGCS
jgi:hypothetical protein